jgi:hypothetical protein
MKINLDLSGTACTRQLDLSALPATHVAKGSKGLGIFMMIFALFWGGLPTIVLIISIASGKFEPGMLLVLFFTLIGAALFVGGLNVVVGSTITIIDRTRVSVTKKSLFGTKQWSEQLSVFDGVLSRSEYHQGGKNQPSYTLYIVELRHADPKKAVKLYESRSDEDFRAIWEDYCRKLNLQALETDGGTLVKRDVEDLDKSVKELVREGKVKVKFDPSKAPPAELSLRVDGDVLELTVVKKKSSPVGYAIALIIPGVFAYIGFFVKGCPILFGIVGAVLFAVVAWGIVWSLIAKDQIRIGKDEIRTRQLTPWGATEGASVRSEGIETVRIGKEGGSGQNGVVLETDERHVTVGAGLSAESLEWLKNCIVRVIAA